VCTNTDIDVRGPERIGTNMCGRTAQAPLNLRTLLYVPTRNTEKLSMQRSESGVSLYARRVLIQARAKALLPDWLRFVKGTS
jgi:HSP90 family molecular chaperone